MPDPTPDVPPGTAEPATPPAGPPAGPADHVKSFGEARRWLTSPEFEPRPEGGGPCPRLQALYRRRDAGTMTPDERVTLIWLGVGRVEESRLGELAAMLAEAGAPDALDEVGVNICLKLVGVRPAWRPSPWLPEEGEQMLCAADRVVTALKFRIPSLRAYRLCHTGHFRSQLRDAVARTRPDAVDQRGRPVDPEKTTATPEERALAQFFADAVDDPHGRGFVKRFLLAAGDKVRWLGPRLSAQLLSREFLLAL